MGNLNHPLNLHNHSGFYDFAAAQAGRADADALIPALNLGVDRAQIDVPAPLSHVVGVADSIPEVGSFSAKIALTSHRNTSRGGRVGKAPQKILTEIGLFAHP